MENWHSKPLGYGSDVYMRLRLLDELRHQICPLSSSPYKLVIDVMSAQTYAIFAPTSFELAQAFDALPCDLIDIDGVRFIDLEYQPWPVSDNSREIFEPVLSRRRNNAVERTRPYAW